MLRPLDVEAGGVRQDRRADARVGCQMDGVLAQVFSEIELAGRPRFVRKRAKAPRIPMMPDLAHDDRVHQGAVRFAPRTNPQDFCVLVVAGRKVADEFEVEPMGGVCTEEALLDVLGSAWRTRSRSRTKQHKPEHSCEREPAAKCSIHDFTRPGATSPAALLRAPGRSYTCRNFQRPRLNTARPTTADSEYASAIAQKTPFGPMTWDIHSAIGI